VRAYLTANRTPDGDARTEAFFADVDDVAFFTGQMYCSDAPGGVRYQRHSGGHERETEAKIIPATGNGMKSHATYDGFLEVTQGQGNRNEPEVHLLMRSNDGDFAQGWFLIGEVLSAVSDAYTPTAEEALSEIRANATSPDSSMSPDGFAAALNRWLAQHDAEVRAEALGGNL